MGGNKGGNAAQRGSGGKGKASRDDEATHYTGKKGKEPGSKGKQDKGMSDKGKSKGKHGKSQQLDEDDDFDHEDANKIRGAKTQKGRSKGNKSVRKDDTWDEEGWTGWNASKKWNDKNYWNDDAGWDDTGWEDETWWED